MHIYTVGLPYCIYWVTSGTYLFALGCYDLASIVAMVAWYSPAKPLPQLGLASGVAVIVLDTVHLALCNYACTVNNYILILINLVRTNVWYICTYTSVSNVQTTNALYTQYRGERGGGNSLQQATLHPCHRHHRHPAQTDRQTDTNTTVCTNDPPPADHPLVGHTWLRL